MFPVLSFQHFTVFELFNIMRDPFVKLLNLLYFRHLKKCGVNPQNGESFKMLTLLGRYKIARFVCSTTKCFDNFFRFIIKIWLCIFSDLFKAVNHKESGNVIILKNFGNYTPPKLKRTVTCRHFGAGVNIPRPMSIISFHFTSFQSFRATSVSECCSTIIATIVLHSASTKVSRKNVSLPCA